MPQIRSNAKWLTLAQIAKVTLQVASVTVLARMLSPEVYGIMAVTLALANFGALFRDAGISAYLIQARDLTEESNSSAFWLSCAAGFSVCLLVCIAAKPLSVFFQQPALLWVLVAVSTTFVMSGISAPYQALMERNGSFKSLAIIEVASQAIALLLAIYAAYRGAGLYSLVTQTVTASCVAMIALLHSSRFRPRRYISKQFASEIWSFSKGYLSYNILSYLSKNSDALAVSRLLGPSSMGIYSVAQRLILMPLQNVTQVANRAIFPILSRQQDDLGTLRQTYLTSIEYISLIVFPIMLGIWSARELFVLVILGPKWAELAQLVFWLAPIGILQALSALTGSVLLAKGSGGKLFKLGLTGSATQLTGILIGTLYGLEGVAIGYFAASLGYFVVQARLLHSSISVSLIDIIKSCRSAAIASAIMATSIFLTLKYVGNHNNMLTNAAGSVLVGLLSYASALYTLFPTSFHRLVSSIRHSSS